MKKDEQVASERLMRFMEQQQQERTPFSKPITDLESIGKHIEQHFSTGEENLLDQELGVLIRELGYS